MKKLYLLLVGSVLLVGSAGALTATLAGCNSDDQDKVSVSDALKQFD